ncbi:MAG: hypothetical protein COB14_03445 [Alphaproteobacteria bacterium]|nr:MAG: hypothetical protein COB14_03445 [Alphaproteobacteria bacterium]
MTVKYPELSPKNTLRGRQNFEFLNESDLEEGSNYDAAVIMGVPFLTVDQLPQLSVDTCPIALIGGGPTLKDNDANGKTILQNLNDNADVIKVVTGSAHTKITNGDLTGVAYCVVGFAADSMCDYMEPQKDITYIVAAQSDFAIFQKIKAAGARVFAVNGYVEGIDQNADDLLGIGSTSATAGLAVFAGILGRKDIQFYGVDSSTSYSYDVPEYEPNEMPVELEDGRIFIVDKGFYDEQTKDLVKFQESYPEVKMKFFGDSVNAGLINDDDLTNNFDAGADNIFDFDPE